MPPETIGLDSLFAEMERELAAKQVPESIGKLARSMGLQPTSVGKPTGTGQQQPSARSEQRPVQVPRISQRQPPQQPQRDPNRLIGTDFGAENLAKRYAERRPVLAQEGPQYEESAFGEARKIWEGALSAAEQESRDIRSRLVLDPMAYPEEQKRQDYARLHGAGEREPAVPGTVNWRAGRAKARLKDVDFAQKLESVNPKVANDFFERSKAFYDLDDRLQVEKRALGSEKQRLDQQRSGMEQRKAEIARLQAEATDALRMPNALEQAFGGVFGQQRDPAQSASIQRDIATHTMKLAAEQKAYNASYNQYLRRSAAARSAEKQRYNLQANYVSARDSARAELEAQQRQQLQAPAPDPQVVGAARAIDPGIYDVTMRRAGHKIKPLSLEGMGKFGRAMFAPVLDTNLDKYQREFLGDERFPSVVRMDIGPDGKQTKHGVVPAMNLTQAQQASRLVEEFLTPHRQRWDATMMAQRRQPIAAMAHGAADVGAEAAAALAQEMALWDTQETATANDEYLRSHSLPGALEYAKQRLGREPTQLEKQVIASQLAWDGYRFAKHPDVQKSILMDAGLAILGEGVGSLVAKPLVGLVGRTAAKLGMKRAVPKVAEAAGGSVLRRPLEVVRSPAQKAVATAAEAVGGVSARVAPNLTAAAGKVAAGANRVIPEVFEPTDMFQNSVASAIQQSGAYLATEENPKADRALLEGLAGLAFGAAATPAFKGVMRGIGAAAKGGWGLTKAGRQWIADNYRNWKDPRDVQAALDQIQSGAVPGQPANPTYAPALRITARFPAKPDARVQAEAPGTTPSTVTTPGASPVVEPELDLPRIVDEEDFAAPSDVVMPRVPPVPPVSQPRPATPTAAPATGQVSTASPTPTSAKPDVPVVEQPASKPSQSETLADIFRAATTAKQAETTGKRRGEAGAGIVKIKDLLPAIVERVPELKRRRGEKPEAYQGRVGQAVKDMLHDHPGEFHSFADSLDPKEQFFGTDSGGIRRTLGWIESKTKPEPQPATVQAGPTAPSVPPVRRPASAPKPKAEPTPEERSLVNSLADRQDQLLDSGDSKAALELLDKELEVRRRYPDYQPEELASVLKWRQSLENRVQREAAEADAAIHRSQPKPAPTSPVVDSQAVRTANFTRGRFPDDPSWAGAFDSSDPAAFDARIQKSPSFEKYAEGSSDREALSALREQWGTLRKSSSAPIEATSPKKATVPAAKASEPAPAPRPETPGQIAYREELERRIAKAEADERMEARVRGQANLPPELSSARPAYKSNPVQFERDYDKAAYTVAGRGESKSHAKYVDWLEDNGYDLQEAKRRGQEIRDDLKGRPVPGVDEDGKAKPYIVESSSRPQNPPAAKGASIPPVTARPRAPRVKAEPVVEARPGPATDTTARAADATAPAAKPDVATPKSAEPRTAKTLSDLAEDFGKKNVTVTKEDLDKNLAVLREMKLLSGAPPPEALQALAKIAVYYVEGGVRAYPDFHRIMLEAVGSKLEPFFRRAYNKARALLDDYPWVAKEMTPDDEIDAFHKAREASPARPSVPKVAIAPDKPVAPKPEPVAPKPRPDWEQKADQKATARNSLLASLTKAINSGDAVEANKIADRIGNLYSDEIELRLDNGQKAQADALAAANDKFYKTIQQWNSRQAKPEVPNAKSPAPNGRKPSLAAIEDGLIASGLLRQEERDAKTSVMPAALLRAIPQGRWVTMKDAVRETVLFRIAADGMIRTGLIERRYDQAGDAFYAWSGTKPLAGMITDEQARTKWPIAEDADPGSEKPRPSVPKIEPEPEKPRRPLTRAEKADAHVATRVEADAEWLRAEGDPRKQAGIATKALQAIDDELAIRDATDPKARVAQAAKRRWADRAKTVKAAVPETLDGSLGPLRYKPETDSYNGLKLKNGDILSDADGGLWAVDRVRGFLLNLERLDDAGSGYKYPRESVTRSVDPTDRVRFSDLEFTGRNLYPEKPVSKAPTRDIEDDELFSTTDNVAEAAARHPLEPEWAGEELDNLEGRLEGFIPGHTVEWKVGGKVATGVVTGLTSKRLKVRLPGDQTVYVPAGMATRVRPVGKPLSSAVDGKTTNVKVKTPEGDSRRYRVRYAVVDLDDLIVSHDPHTFDPNLEYDEQFQPRGRDADGTRAQVVTIEKKFDPEEVGQNLMADLGAPIVDRRTSFVISGNGRTMAINRVAKNDPAKWGEYTDWLKESAPDFGVSAKALDGINRPVLVRVLDEDLSPEELLEFVQLTNDDLLASKPIRELAVQDAGKITNDLLQAFDVGESGDITAASNKAFVQGFLHSLSANERNGLVAANGVLNVDGKNRLQAALFYKAYKDKDALARMADAVDADAKNVTNAMVQAAPALIQHNEGIRAGYLQSLGISQDVAAAANRFYDLRRNNMAVSTFLDTKQLLGEELDGFQRTLLKFLDDNKRSAVRIKETIAAYVDLATREGDPRDRSMFGDDVPKKPVKSREELWDLAAKRVEEDRAKAPQKPKQAVQGQPSSPTTLMQWSSPAKQMAITDLGQETIEEAVGNQVASLRGMATLPGIIGKLRDRHSVREITDAVNRMESSGSIFRDGSIYRRGPKPASSDGGDLKMKAAAESQMTLFQKQSGEAKAGDSVGKPTEPMATEPTPPELHGLGEYEARMADMLERRFGHTAEQAKAVATEVAAIADAWAKDTGRTPQEWYDRNIKSFARGTGGPSDAKGMIQFLPDGRAILVALNNPDVTTSIHEVGHILRRSLYDRLDEATDEARPSIEADIAALEAWVGAGEVKGKAWSEAAEEKFARGWERYHATGKAPTPKLQGIFDRMKAWFLGIYKAIKGSDIDVDLPPEVVAAYDRLLTGERKAHSATVRPVPEVRTRTGAPKPSRPVSPDKPATAATGVFGTGKPALRTDGSSVLESGTPDEIFTGLANAMNEAAVERGVISELPPKGDVRSIRDSYDAGVAEYAAKGGLSHAEQLAEEVADGRRAFSWDTVGVLTQGLRDLENAVNAAMDKMVRAKHRGLDIGLKTAAGEFQAAQERLARYLANVQIGKTEWHNTGMALQQMVSLEYGNFARLERRARQMKGGDLLPSERANLQDMAKRYQELEAAYNEQLSKTEQVLAAQRATVSRQRAEEARAALARSARDPKSLMKNAGEIGQKARQSAAEVLASLKRKFSNLADGVNNLQQRSGARVPKVQQPTVLKQSMPPKKTLVPYDPDVQPGVAREIAKLVIQMDPKRNLYQMADEVVRMFADDANIEITPEQVIEEFGATASQSEMAEVARRIMALKGEARRHQQYIDKLQGRQAPPKPKSPHTDAPSTEALKAQVKAQEDAARAKKKADADLARTQAKIADVQAKIAAMTAQVQAGRGSVAPSVPRPSNAPPALKALRDELAALKIEARKQQRLRDIIATGQVPTSQPRATRPDSPATEALKAQAEPIFKADRKARAEARKQDVALQNRLRAERTQRAKDKVQAEINMLNKALQDGVLPAEWNAKKGPSKNVDHELEMLRYKRHLLKTEVNATLEELTPRDIMDTLLAFSQFPKVLTASWDISAAGRQGWRLGLAHPGIARQAFKRQIEALNSGDAAARIQYELLNRKNAPYYKKMGIDVTSKEEMFAYMPILKHWKKGNPYLASDRAYSTYLNQLRTGVADKILGDHPERFSEADLKLLGDYINQASGRGGGTDYAAAAKFLSLIFYAPRFMASHVTYLTVTPLRLLNGKYTPEMRKAILKSYIQTAAAYSALVGLAKLGEAMGGGAITVENDPRSADWGKVKFGDTRVDITGGTAGYLSLATRISKHSKVSSTTGKETELDTGEFGGTTSWDELGRFLRNKLAPLPSVGVSTHIGLDFRGRQYGWAEAIKDVTAPMSAREVLEAVADSGVDGEDALQLLNIIGLSTTRYVPERIDWTAKHKVGLPRADRDVVEKELFRLKDHVGPPPFAVKHDDEELRLTKAEREESRAKMAPMIYQALRQMFDDKYYKASDDKSKEKMIRAEASKVRAAAMGEIRQRKIEEYEREQAAAR